MSRALRASLAALGALLCSSLAAGADERAAVSGEAAPLSSTQQLSFNLGLASPLGFGGVSYSFAASELLRMELGLGYGVTGAQISLMPKLVSPLNLGTNVLIGFGPSLSIKQLDQTQYASEFHQTGVATWLNAEVGVEQRLLGSHLLLTAAIGLSIGLSSNYLLDVGGGGWFFGASDYQTTRGMILPEAHVGMGVAF